MMKNINTEIINKLSYNELIILDTVRCLYYRANIENNDFNKCYALHTNNLLVKEYEDKYK